MSSLDLNLAHYNILIIEDSLEYQSLILQSLGKGPGHICASTLAEAREICSQTSFDCIIVDLSLPDGSGFDFLQSQTEVKCPVIILSASSEIGNKALGFSLGVQDYIEKPFQPMELAIRVKAKIFDSKEKSGTSSGIDVGNLSFDYNKRSVTIRGERKSIHPNLSRREIDLLLLFIKNPERIYEREQILDLVWGRDNYVLERSVDSTIAAVRKKLKVWNYKISTIYGVGYLLERKESSFQKPPLELPLIELFESETQKQLDQLGRFYQKQNWEECIKSVHKIKGSFANFTDELIELSDEIEGSEANEKIGSQLELFIKKAQALRIEILRNAQDSAA